MCSSDLASRLDLSAYDGGTYVTTFLSPRGYHFVHAPEGGELLDVRWLAGRWFPQNEDALQHIPAIYERNERAVLRLRTGTGGAEGDSGRTREVIMVMVGASVIGGIELRGIPRERWVGPRPFALRREVHKGDEVGHFTFGSTVAKGPASKSDMSMPSRRIHARTARSTSARGRRARVRRAAVPLISAWGRKRYARKNGALRMKVIAKTD